MARSTEAFTDERGNLHHSVTDAILADIASALGRVGDNGGLTSGVARLVLEKRSAIEQAFADFDRLTADRVRPMLTACAPANDKATEAKRWNAAFK